jgi:hypothetical protein
MMKTILSRSYLINLYPFVNNDSEIITVHVLWGIVQKDESNRFLPNDYVCTSAILNRLAENQFVTKNNLYCCISKPFQLTLPPTAILKLRAGNEPLLLYEALRNGTID